MIADRAILVAADRRARAIATDWGASAAYRHIADAFERAGSDDAEVVAAAAEALLQRDDWIEPLLAPLIAALADDPWFAPPLRISRDAVRTGAILYAGPGASLTATIVSADALAAVPPVATIVASGRLGIVRYIRAGGMRLRCWRAGRATGDLVDSHSDRALALPDVALTDGVILRLDGRSNAYHLDCGSAGAGGNAVTLTVTIRAGADRYVREFRRDDGRLVRAAAIDEAPSRAAMLLTLLRLSGRADAAAVFAGATRDAAFFLRWQAMREWLALDAAAALPRLAEMAAADCNTEVRDAARATLAKIAATRKPRAGLCPA